MINKSSLTVLIIVLLTLNFLVALGCLLFGLFFLKKEDKPKRKHYILLGICIFSGPVIMPVSVAAASLASRFFHKDKESLSAVTFSKERVKTLVSADFELETNFVSVKEALLVSDVSRLRRLVLDIIRSEKKEYLSKLSEALKSEDSETSHYAAAAIVEALTEFRDTVKQMNEELSEDCTDFKLNIELLELLIEFLSHGILSDYEIGFYTDMTNDVAENLFSNNKEAMTPIHYLGIVNSLVEYGKYDLAQMWSERAFTYSPNSLENYIGRLRIQYEKRDNKGFFETMDVLKKSDVVFDSKTLEMIRMFK